MSRDEGTGGPRPQDGHGRPAGPGSPDGTETAPDGPGPAPRFAVVISADGSASIDGRPVPVAEGEALDAAILDALHAHADRHNATVTASISDPSADYVALVEVAPDGSSRLVEQPAEDAPASPPPPPASSSSAVRPGGPDGVGPGSGGPGRDGGPGGSAASGASAASSAASSGAYGREAEAPRRQPVGAPPARSAPSPSSGTKAGRKGGPRQSDDEYAPPRLLNRPLVVGPMALIVAALVITPLAVLGSGGADEEEDRRQNARSSHETPASPSAAEPLPTVSVSSRTVPPPPPTESARPSGTPGRGKAAKPDVKSTVTVTARPPRATATVTAKPAQETAADAVKRLAANDPSGRHICYRAYVSGKGWQKPVCDGTLAGTSGQDRPVKALNIAVHGTGGSAANAFVHRPGSKDGKGVWKPKWTAVIADGRNNYVGSTERDAPDMLGFAVNVGSGRICQTTRVRGADWGGQTCADARPGFLFGGTLTNDSWLEAVRLTV